MNSLLMLGLPLLACLLMTGILSYVGLHVLKREVIFIDIAAVQVAALGAIAAHMGFDAHVDSPTALGCSVGATLLAALFFAVVRRRIRSLPIEATIGIAYAIAAAGALFLIGKSAEGHTHVQNMLAGSLLWVDGKDLAWFAAACLGVGAAFYLFRRPLQAISDDYDAALRAGRRVVGWDFVFYALCGLAVTFAVRLAGVVVVFCFLIIPATASALFAVGWRVRLLIAWAVGAVSSIAGLLFCHWLDFSAGVSVSLLLGVCLIASGICSGVAGRHPDAVRPAARHARRQMAERRIHT